MDRSAVLLEPEARHGDVARALVVPGDVGVDAEHVHDDPVGPRAGRVVGREEDVAPPRAHHVRHDQVEPAVVVPDRGGPGASAGRHAGRAELTVAHRDVGQELDVLEVGRPEDRDAREVLERGRRDEVLVAHAAHAGVGVEARDQGIAHGAVLRWWGAGAGVSPTVVGDVPRSTST
ncbi:hypothetical protein D3C74_355700 [compost metagenome]